MRSRSDQNKKLPDIVRDLINSGARRRLELPRGLILSYTPPDLWSPDGARMLGAGRAGVAPSVVELRVILSALRAVIKADGRPLLSGPDLGPVQNSGGYYFAVITWAEYDRPPLLPDL